jgi:hypothetical protein
MAARFVISCYLDVAEIKVLVPPMCVFFGCGLRYESDWSIRDTNYVKTT